MSAERPTDLDWATSPDQLAKTRRILEDNTTASERSPITRRRTLALIDEIERLRAHPVGGDTSLNALRGALARLERAEQIVTSDDDELADSIIEAGHARRSVIAAARALLTAPPAPEPPLDALRWVRAWAALCAETGGRTISAATVVEQLDAVLVLAAPPATSGPEVVPCPPWCEGDCPNCHVYPAPATSPTERPMFPPYGFWAPGPATSPEPDGAEPDQIRTIYPNGWTTTAYGDDTEWPWWTDDGDPMSWVAITYHWPAEPGETATIGCPRPGLAPEHWTWELVSPGDDGVVLDGTTTDPSAGIWLQRIVDVFHADAIRFAATRRPTPGGPS